MEVLMLYQRLHQRQANKLTINSKQELVELVTILIRLFFSKTFGIENVDYTDQYGGQQGVESLNQMAFSVTRSTGIKWYGKHNV